MSPPVATPHSTFEIPKPDFHSSHTFKSQESFDFSADSPTYTAGFSFSKTGTEKPHVSSRRPRLMKMRRRQMPTPRDGKTDLRINASSGFSGDKLGNVFGVNDRNSGSNGSGARTDSNGNMDRFGSGLAPGASLNGSSFDFGSGNGLFSSSMNSSTFNAQKETGSFMFGARKDCPTVNQKLPGDCSFGVEKDTGGNLGQSEVNAQSVFCSDSYGSASQVKLGQQDSNKSGLGLNAGEFGRFSSANVVSGAAKGGPSKIDSVNVDKSEADKVSGNRIPDVRGKVKLDTSGDSDKVRNPCSQFPFSCSDNSNKNCVFGIDLEKKSTVRNRDMHDFTDSGIGKENADNGYLSQNACVNGVFVFGGFKGKGGFNSNGSTNPLNEVSEVNRVKADDCDGFGQHGRDSCSDVNSKFRSSGDSFEKEPAFSIKDKMNKLNIGDSEVDKKSGIFGGNYAVNTNNVFVFRDYQKNSDFVKENKPSMSQKTPEVGRSTHNNSESDRAWSSFFSSAGIGVELNGGFCEVPSMNKVEKDSLNFTGILGGLDSSSADYSTPNLKFDFSKINLFPGINKLDNSNLRSLGSKKSKKKTGKLRQRTVVQDLFRQNHASEGNVQQNHESPGYGSPMDFSPYQDKSTNAPVADTGAGIKENLPTSENHISEHCEKPRDDVSTSKFSPSSTAKDGLSALHTQYKKKYKLKVRSNPTIQTNNPVKENAKQEPSGTTIHEACEQWRIRGNEAYHAGQLSKAEEFYSMGINSSPHISAIGYSMKSLLLCYSNRAATRMSLGRMREAIEDCTKASELDPDFLKATLRAGNCYLVLGEVEEAIIYYTKCLSDGTSICLDRRVTIEAADGLNKAKKVAEQMLQSANLLQEGSDDAATSAMGIIEEALLISRFSEQLLQMKGEVLYTLRMYDEVIQLCERTLDVAQKNLSLDNHKCKNSHVKLWRWHLQAKSHFRLGKLDSALDLIEKQENLSFSSKSGDETRDSAIALAANIRELLSLKKSGNEAFSSGRYTEAIENYTSAISKSYESRGFMAICFCNRAAAYQSLGQIIDSISDCSIAIALDENYVKAISRRATLHEMIRDYKQAIYDLQKLVSLLESQSQTKNQARSSGGSVRDLRKARRRLSLAEEKAKKEISLDLYLILGIKQSDTESEIKKAYRKAALRHHPDKAGQVLARNDVADDGTLRKEFGEKIHTDADRLFKVIGEAYAVLSDPSKRSKYDDEEEMRKIYRDSNRNSNSEHPSTSYTSPFERGNSYGRQSGYSNTRRYWYEAKSYSNSRW